MRVVARHHHDRHQDISGNYVVQLIVFDGIAESLPDTASITVFSPDSAIEVLSVAFNAIASSPVEAFVNRNSPRALLNKLEAVIRQVENGELESARAQLSSDLKPKLDGCVLRGAPDSSGRHVRDWISECGLQEEVSYSVKEAIHVLDLLIPDQP